MKKNLLFLLVASLFFLYGPLVDNIQAQTVNYNITGTVYSDVNQNGIQDSGESGYADVSVGLRLGGVRKNTLTDSNGNYTFSNIPIGNAVITMTPPAGYVETVKNPASFVLNSDTTQNFGIVAIPVNTLTSTGGYLTSISCPKSEGVLCMTVGEDVSQSIFHGKILKTADGSNWTEIQDFPNTSFGAIACPHIGGIFCVATAFDLNDSQGKLFTTSDGVSWANISNLPDLSTVQFSDNSIICPNSGGILCVAVGSGSLGNPSTILITADGITWTKVENLPSDGVISDIACPNTNGVFCVGVGVRSNTTPMKAMIYTTVDGINWTNAQNIPTNSDDPSATFLQSVACPNSGGVLCIAVGASQNSSIILTTVDGITWTKIPNVPNYQFESIVCPNNGDILCAAVAGNNILTTVNGVDWTNSEWRSLVVGTYSRYHFNDIACPISEEISCLAVGDFEGVKSRFAAIGVVTPQNSTHLLSGTIFIDLNQNGIQDTGESGYQGATLSLNSGQTATTDANGNYSFSNIPTGTYTETLTVPNSYIATTTNPVNVPLTANTTENFGIVTATTTLTPIADSYIKEGSQNENEGASTFLRIQSAGHNRALVKFDQSQIQQAVGNSQNYTATLQFTISDNGNNWGATGRTIDLARLTQNWAEGNGFIAGNTPQYRGIGSGVTWNCATDSNIANKKDDCSGNTAWNMSNSSLWPFVSKPTATATITNNQTGTVTFTVTSDIQSFINNTNQNYGWLVKKNNESQNGQVSFSSKEGTTSPKLIIIRN